jgi:hypothetical protein
VKQVADRLCTLPDLFFNPEDRGYMYLRNVDWLSTDYMASLHKHYSENLRSYKGSDVFIISNEIISIIVKNTILTLQAH